MIVAVTQTMGTAAAPACPVSWNTGLLDLQFGRQLILRGAVGINPRKFSVNSNHPSMRRRVGERALFCGALL